MSKSVAKSVTLNTVQGIGDLFWVYQKLAPHVDAINLNILCTRPESALHRRAEGFAKMLPKVGAVEFVRVDLAEYKRVAGIRVPMASVLASEGPVDYAVNGPLEQGVPIREIDPEYAIEEFVDLGLSETVEQGDYLCAFVAGAQNDLCWTSRRWVDVISKLAARIGTPRVALIGAAWDQSVQAAVAEKLRAVGYAVENHVGALDLAASIGVIRRAAFFVGYQSGLNVLADNYDVPQLMIYYKSLEPMMYTWCKRENMKTRFHAATFECDIDATIASMP